MLRSLCCLFLTLCMALGGAGPVSFFQAKAEAPAAVVSPSGDTYLTSAGGPYGEADTLRVRAQHLSAYNSKKALLKFDLEVPEGKVITSAVLCVWAWVQDNSLSQAADANTLKCFGLENDAWNENTLHSNAPEDASFVNVLNFDNDKALLAETLLAYPNPQDCAREFDVTEFVRAQSAGDGTATFSLQGKQTVSGETGNELRLYSKEYSDEDKRPRLIVTYGEPYMARIPPDGWKNTQWNDPGGWSTLNVTENGLDKNNPSTDAAQAIANMIGTTSGRRTLYFPAGTYYFKTPLTVFVGDIRFVGDGAETVFHYNGLPAQNVGITFSGALSGSPVSVSGFVPAGANVITVADAGSFAIGDIVQLYAEKAPLVNNGLAWGTSRIYAQMVKIIGKNANTLTVDMKIGLPYHLSYQPKVQKYNMLQNIGFEKIKIIRDEQTADEKVGNLQFSCVYNGYVADTEMHRCARSHISVSNSKSVVVERNYLRDTFWTDEGNSGYGIFVTSSTGCRITDNKTANLRHHIILHTGANHNVVSYNSLEPDYYSYNDLSLHAVYPYMNLFEGNTFFEGYGDNSKAGTGVEESNGPYNTWFRNLAVRGVGSAQNGSNRQNMIGNVVSTVMDSAGGDHYSAANIVNGQMLWGAAAENTELPASLYLDERPPFLNATPWPVFGPGALAWGQDNMLPAKARFGICDDFDSQSDGEAPQGWSLTEKGGTARIAADAEGQALFLDKTDGLENSKVEISKNVALLRNITTLEFSFKRDSTSGWWCVPYLFNSANQPVVTMALTDGQIKINENGTWKDVQAFSAGTWYRVRMEMDTHTDKADIYINGVLKKSGAAFRQETGDISRAVIYAAGATVGGLYLDDVRLYGGKSLYPLMDYTFDADTTGRNPGGYWTTNLAGGEMSVYEESEGKSLHMNCTSSATLSLKRSLPNVSKPIWLEYKIRRSETSGWWSAPYLYKSGTMAQSIAFADGNIKYHNSVNWVNIQSFTANKWYHVRMRFDIPLSVFDLYIDGEEKFLGAPFRTPVDWIGSVEFYTAGALGSAYIDDILMYYDRENEGGLFADSPGAAYSDGSAVGDAPVDMSAVRIWTKVYDQNGKSDVTLIAGLFGKDGSLGAVKMKSGPENKKTYLLSTEVDLPQNSADYYLKVMIWKGVEGMQPFSEPYFYFKEGKNL